ncbi:unnamed protein product, partial [Polarella glacialis]
IYELEAYNNAARARYDQQHVQVENLYEDFMLLCLACGCAWMSAQAMFEVACRCLRGESTRWYSNGNLLVARSLAASVLALLVPPLALAAQKSRYINGHSRLSAFMQLLKKALPMTIGWAWKDLLAQLTRWSEEDKGVPPYVIRPVIAVGITVYVASLLHIPQVKAALKEGQHSQGTLLQRYLCLSGSYMLAVGYSYNQFVRYLVMLVTDEISKDAEIYAILHVVVQAFYFSALSVAIMRITTWWSAREDGLIHDMEVRERQRETSNKPNKIKSHPDSHIVMDGVQIELGEVFVHGLAFVYAWGLYDLLQSFFFPVLMSCPSWKTCDFRKNFLFALIVTIFSFIFTGLERSAKKKTKAGQSAQLLITTALSLTCIWSWSNFYSTILSRFTSTWTRLYPSNVLTVLGWHLFFTLVAWLFMSALYYKELDRLRIARRTREELNQQHPLEHMDLEGILEEIQ